MAGSSVTAARTLDQLGGWDWADICPVAVSLDGRIVQLEKPVRFLPGRRLVAFSTTSPGSVFKLFFGQRGVRDFRQERDNLAALAAAGMTVPAVLACGELDTGAWLELERIPDSASLVDHLHSPHVQQLYLDQLLALYRAGWVQSDPHWDNFLFDGESLWLIDAGGMRKAGSAEEIEDNAALVLAQCGANQQALESHMLDALASGLQTNPQRLDDLLLERRQQRIRRFLDKALRSSTRVALVAHAGATGLRQRALPQAQLEGLLKDIERGEGDELLKDGRSATVYASGDYVIKRYNCLSLWQRIKRALGRDRAMNAWRMGLALNHFGIASPLPVLYLAAPRGVRYLVTQRIEGASELQQLLADDSQKESAIARCREAMAALHRFGFWHGDAKARNFLLRDERVWLIDLDATGWSANNSRVSAMAERDRKRFQRNG